MSQRLGLAVHFYSVLYEFGIYSDLPAVIRCLALVYQTYFQQHGAFNRFLTDFFLFIYLFMSLTVNSLNKAQ